MNYELLHFSLSHFPFQACTEMTLPSDTNNVTDMFPPYKYNVSAYCMEKWNVRSRPNWMKAQFWGKSEQKLLSAGVRMYVTTELGRGVPRRKFRRTYNTTKMYHVMYTCIQYLAISLLVCDPLSLLQSPIPLWYPAIIYL